MLALAKRRRMWDYDAVTLSAACNSPVLITEGLAGVRGKYGKLIKLTAPHFCFKQICGVLGFTINDTATNFS